MSPIPFLGEILALASPISWSFAVILFRKAGENVPPLPLNLFKNIFGLVLFSLTWILQSGGIAFGVDAIGLRPAVATALAEGRSGSAFLRWDPAVLLMVSGALGIGVCDTLFLMCLNRVGAGLLAIITTSYSPSIILCSMWLLGERLTAVQSVGVFIILGAVLSVSWVKGPRSSLPRRTLVVGTIYGVLAMITQAISLVMVKPLLDVAPLMWANCWRLAGGLVIMGIALPVLTRTQRADFSRLLDRRSWRYMVGGAFLGTYISLMLWLGGMKYTSASIASALNQSATFWTFLLAALLLHEPVTLRRVLGLVAGLVGIALVTFG